MSREFGTEVVPPIHRVHPCTRSQSSPEKTGALLGAPALRRTLIDVPKVKNVARASDGQRLVLFRFPEQADFSPEALDFLKAQSAELVPFTINLDYDYWTSDEILHSVLPVELADRSPSGFAAVGHIAHLNLNAEYLPYKRLIGQVILDKNPSIRTVVNKLDTIDTQFRVFKMELLAGEPDYVVEHSESACRFKFDFTEVYWNSRLHTEHGRLIEQFNAQDVVADVFAGVGPFAIPAAKKGCGVLANDLNPNSHKYLVHNIEDNKVTKLVRASCEDGRDFIRTVFNRVWDDPLPPVAPPKLSKSQQKEKRRERKTSRPPSPQAPPAPRRKRITQLVMNLPDTAILFLDAFRGVLSPDNAGDRDLCGVYDRSSLPMIHCYCFTRELEPDKAETDIRQRVEEQIGHPIAHEVGLHLVRSVAPNKDMYCISFRLPYEVAYAC
ncbi:tRNA (guanine(37)-N1)-methyltransferase [Grifola frondosa]|uniref:tRNA (guanine(37)-N1)-methyltransferase n=1 Tax=Grifola frondosa TaxID=5627 RepID=A0A1C7MT41_GRIFR|nr:tRNA (guanine(37)-N1)-methyltransferase [Grifola frondosa]